MEKRTEDAGATVIGTAIVNETPDHSEECAALGKKQQNKFLIYVEYIMLF